MVDSDKFKSMIGMEFHRHGNRWKKKCLFKLLEWKVWTSLLGDDDLVLMVLNDM